MKPKRPALTGGSLSFPGGAMPRRYLQVCNHPGCPTLTYDKKCDAHRRGPDNRPSSYQRGYDEKWKRTRRAFLAAHPMCQRIGCGQLATDVDHIDGLGPLGPRGHDWDNLRSLCHSDHSKRTARDQPGGWAARSPD